MQALERLKNLKHLAICNCTRISVLILQAIGAHCKGLEELEIEGNFICSKIEEVLHLTQLVNLKVLKCKYSTLMTDELLIKLAQQCQQLISIDITGNLQLLYDIYFVFNFNNVLFIQQVATV